MSAIVETRPLRYFAPLGNGHLELLVSAITCFLKLVFTIFSCWYLDPLALILAKSFRLLDFQYFGAQFGIWTCFAM